MVPAPSPLLPPRGGLSYIGLGPNAADGAALAGAREVAAAWRESPAAGRRALAAVKEIREAPRDARLTAVPADTVRVHGASTTAR
jgi:hypothetical protein